MWMLDTEIVPHTISLELESTRINVNIQEK